MTKIRIKVSELKDIMKLAELIPESTHHLLTFITIEEDESSGIGSTLTATIPYTIDGIEGKFTTVIAGVESW